MSDIVLYSITYEIDGKLYTTRMDYDHSWFCDIDMDDLVLVEEEETKGSIKFNARQFVDKLREVDERLYEEALDTIAWKGYERVGTWEDDEEGNMILLEDEE